MKKAVKKKKKNSFFAPFTEEEKQKFEKIRKGVPYLSDYRSWSDFCKKNGFRHHHAKSYAVGRSNGDRAKELRRLVSEIGLVV